MKVLILGSQGFIGSHLVTSFANLSFDVFCADIAIENSTRSIRLNPVAPNFHSVFETVKPEVCVNCSGAANVPESFKSPLADFTLNSSRVFDMLDAIRSHSPATKFINLSSAAVYGNPSENPITEFTPIGPLSPYGTHKHIAEQICREFSNHHDIGTHTLRIFSAYGPGLRKQLLWDVFQKAQASSRVELFGTGDETRDFIYVSDVAKAIACVIRSGKFDGSATNIASGKSTSVRYAALSLLNALGFQREVTFSGQSRLGDPVTWTADVSALQSLGMREFTSFDNGIQHVAAWLKRDLQERRLG